MGGLSGEHDSKGMGERVHGPSDKHNMVIIVGDVKGGMRPKCQAQAQCQCLRCTNRVKLHYAH